MALKCPALLWKISRMEIGILVLVTDYDCKLVAPLNRLKSFLRPSSQREKQWLRVPNRELDDIRHGQLDSTQDDTFTRYQQPPSYLSLLAISAKCQRWRHFAHGK